MAISFSFADDARLALLVETGGITDGAGVNAALKLGACAAQLGTAIISCPGSGVMHIVRRDATASLGKQTLARIGHGQDAPLRRAMPAADLVHVRYRETEQLSMP